MHAISIVNHIYLDNAIFKFMVDGKSEDKSEDWKENQKIENVQQQVDMQLLRTRFDSHA